MKRYLHNLSKVFLIAVLLTTTSTWSHNEAREVQLKDDEIAAILQNEHAYVFIGDEASTMLATLKEIAHMADHRDTIANIKQLLWLAEQGYKTARTDMVHDALEHEAVAILEKHSPSMSDARWQKLSTDLDEAVELVTTGALTLVTTRSPEDNDRNCGGKSKTFCNITVTGSAKIGTLFVTGNETINGNLLVDGNLQVNNTAFLTNIVVNGVPFTDAFIQNGNSFGAPAFLGTNDVQPLNIETSGTTRMQITSAGDVNVAGGDVTLQNQGQLRLQNPAGTFSVGLQAPALLADYTLTLPLDDGNANEVLTTNGSGILSWSSLAGLNAFVQNGNSFGAPAVLGTNDVQPLSFETAGVTRATISTTGDTTFNGIVTATGASHAFIARNSGNNNLQTRVGYDTVDDRGFIGARDAAGNFKAFNLYLPSSTPVPVFASQNVHAVNSFLAGDGVIMFTTFPTYNYGLYAAGTQAVGGNPTNKATRMIWALIVGGAIAWQSGGLVGITHVPASGIYKIDYGAFPAFSPVAVVTPFTAGTIAALTVLGANTLTVALTDSTGAPTDQGFCIIIMGEES